MSTTQMETAILLTDWTSPHPSSGGHKLCSSLTPLLGKPLLQRSLENLVLLGCKQVHVFLGDNPGPVRELLGNGERWGVQLHYHYLQLDQDLPANLRRLQLDEATQYWLACDDRVQAMPTPLNSNAAGYWATASERRWAGLGCFSGNWLNTLQGCCNRQDFENRLQASPAIQWTPVAQPLSCESDADFLRSARACLDANPSGTPDNIHIGRSAVIHPSAVLKGPVWIGHLAHVSAGVQLGPYTVLEHGAVVDQGAAVQNSVVVPDTYVGMELNLYHCVAAPGRLARVDQDVVLDELDPTLLTSVRASRGIKRPAPPLRMALRLLKIALLPLWWWGRRVLRSNRQKAPIERMRLLRPGGGPGQTQTLHLANTLGAIDAGEPVALTQHFVHTFYPGLSAVVRGQLVLCGPRLREADHVTHLPAYWRSLYEQHPCGLLHPFMLGAACHMTEDPYAQDMLTVADNSLRLRLRLLGSYLKQLIQELLAPRTSHQPNLTPRR